MLPCAGCQAGYHSPTASSWTGGNPANEQIRWYLDRHRVLSPSPNGRSARRPGTRGVNHGYQDHSSTWPSAGRIPTSAADAALPRATPPRARQRTARAATRRSALSPSTCADLARIRDHARQRRAFTPSSGSSRPRHPTSQREVQQSLGAAAMVQPIATAGPRQGIAVSHPRMHTCGVASAPRGREAAAVASPCYRAVAAAGHPRRPGPSVRAPVLDQHGVSG